MTELRGPLAEGGPQFAAAHPVSISNLCRFDIETGKRVRMVPGHSDVITDVSFSSDGRWLLSSSRDGTLRVYDIPTARTLQVSTVSVQESESSYHLSNAMLPQGWSPILSFVARSMHRSMRTLTNDDHPERMFPRSA